MSRFWCDIAEWAIGENCAQSALRSFMHKPTLAHHWMAFSSSSSAFFSWIELVMHLCQECQWNNGTLFLVYSIGGTWCRHVLPSLILLIYLKYLFYNFIILFIWPCQILVVACGIFRCGMPTLNCSMWGLVPWPGMEPGPLHWKHGILVTGPPGKSSYLYLF